MNGYGEWLQLSVFQCRLSRKRKVELQAALGELINHNADHVLLLDLGHADKVELRGDQPWQGVRGSGAAADHHLSASLCLPPRRERSGDAPAPGSAREPLAS
jgi:hypothetical protein